MMPCLSIRSSLCWCILISCSVAWRDFWSLLTDSWDYRSNSLSAVADFDCLKEWKKSQISLESLKKEHVSHAHLTPGCHSVHMPLSPLPSDICRILFTDIQQGQDTIATHHLLVFTVPSFFVAPPPKSNKNSSVSFNSISTQTCLLN